MGSVRLFVYGSLKRAGKHHEELRGARFVGEARTAPGFELVPLTSGPSSYWALVRTPGSAASVPGELFDVPAELLPELDAFEGTDYVRDVIPLAIVGKSGRNSPEGTALAYLKKSR